MTALGLLLLLAAPAWSKGLESEAELRAIERAHVAAGEIKESYRKALEKFVAGGGLAKGEPGCRVDLPGDKSVVAVGRTSQRLRNPKNVAPAWVQPYLRKFSEQKGPVAPVLVPLGKNHYGYLEPIVVQPICLNCHGTHLEKGVKDSLRTYYPHDQAVGYAVGDFRGVLWLEQK